jgi:hypothetical protein
MTDSIEEALRFVNSVVDAWSTEADLELNGGRLVCQTPRVAPLARLHHLFPPLDDVGIKLVNEKIGFELPEEMQSLLSIHNGLNLFGGSISIYGLRQHYRRLDDSSLWQPYDLANHQDVEFGKFDIVIGGVGPDGNRLLMGSGQKDVSRVDQETGAVLQTWPSLAIMVVDQVTILSKLYDKEGRLVSETVPVGYAPPRPQTNYSEIKPVFGSRAWWWAFKEKFFNR